MARQVVTDTVPLDYDLTCWYLNVRRVMELVGVHSILPDLKTIAAIGEVADPLRKNALPITLKDNLVQWLRQNNPPTLGQLLIQDSLRPNALFTHYSNYFCRGSRQVSEALRKGKPFVPQLEAYSKLDEFHPGQRVTFRFNHEHLTANSSWTELNWIFPSAVTGRCYHASPIQQDYIRPAGRKLGLGDIGWHTFRHTYRSWLDLVGTPIGVQQKLMRHAQIATTMNVYGNAMMESKREANSKVVQMVLRQEVRKAK
jgi:hypothetical protein